MLERLQKVLLELEMGQLFFLQKSHGKLPQGIKGKETNMGIIVTTNLNGFLFKFENSYKPKETDFIEMFP